MELTFQVVIETGIGAYILPAAKIDLRAVALGREDDGTLVGDCRGFSLPRRRPTGPRVARRHSGRRTRNMRVEWPDTKAARSPGEDRARLHRGTDESELAVAPCGPAAAPWVVAATVLGSGMTFLDGTVVNASLPVLQSRLGATVADAQWIVEAYALTLASLLLVGGALGDRYGRRRVFSVGVALFALASGTCGLAPGVRSLIGARAIQGVAAALLVPGSLAILRASFEGVQRGRAIGTWSSFSAVAAGIGPMLGGWLVESVSWRWIFFLNLPLAAAALAIARRHVPESRDDRATGRLDVMGAALAVLGLAGLVFGLVESGRRGWSDPVVWATLVLGALALAAFVAVEARSRAPMMPLGLFRSRAFAGANLLTLFLYAALGGVLFLLPYELILAQGYSAFRAGASLLPLVVSLAVLSRGAGALAARTGPRWPLTVGPALAALGFALFAVPGAQAGSYWKTFFPAVLGLGLGMGITVAPLTDAVMGAAGSRRAGLASGINNTVSRAAAVLAVAVLGAVVVQVSRARLVDRLGAIDLPARARAELGTSGSALGPVELPASLDAKRASAVTEAYAASLVDGFRVAVLLGAGLAAAASATGWWAFSRSTASRIE
jgi:EmrB/QacA subfamily drug resistance transporter